jgi:E3 ubiquitin-protein ligase MARCH6
LFIAFVLTLEIFLLDLFAFAVGICIISTIIAASRDSFIYMTSGRTHLLASVICKWGVTAIKSAPLLFIWVSNLIDVVSFFFPF